MPVFRAPRRRWFVCAGLLGLISVGLASVASAVPLAKVTVRIPQSITVRSMAGVQSEILDARTKLQRDHARPIGTGAKHPQDPPG